MAKRRGVRKPIDLSGIDRMLQMFIQNSLLEKRAVADDLRTSERMREQQGIDTAQAMLPGVMSGQLRPERFGPEFSESLGMGSEFPYSLAPSQSQLEQPGLQQIREAKTQSEVPDIQTLISERASRGRIGAPNLEFGEEPPPQLAELTGTLKARQSRLGSINEAQQLENDRQLAMAKGTARETGLGQEQAAAETFPAQLGRERQSAEQGNQLALDQFQSMTPFEVDRAGGIADAQNQSRLSNSEWLNPAIVGEKLEFERRKGIESALTARNAAQASAIDQSVNTVISIQGDIQRMQDLSEQVNVRSGINLPGRLMDYGGASTQTGDPNAAELDRIAANISKRLGNDPFFGGNKGAQSEADSKAILGRLPNSFDSAEVAQRKIASFNKNLFDVVQAQNESPVSLDPLSRINLARQMFGLDPQDRLVTPAGMTLPPDPNSAYPGEPPPLPDGIPSRDSIQQFLEQRRERR